MVKMAVGMDENSIEKKDGEYEEYELKCAVDTLLEAEKIKKDPKMMAAIKPLLDEKAGAIKSISSIADLKKVAKEKINEPEK